jgi:hypothetical protein
MDPFRLDGQMARDQQPWTPQEEALIGTDTDRAIAAKLKRSSTAVSNRRMKLGIPSYNKRRGTIPDPV